MSKNKYNEEPVEYCLNCGSLHILEENEITVCGKCGCTNFTAFTKIEEWLKRK